MLSRQHRGHTTYKNKYRTPHPYSIDFVTDARCWDATCARVGEVLLCRVIELGKTGLLSPRPAFYEAIKSEDYKSGHVCLRCVPLEVKMYRVLVKYHVSNYLQRCKQYVCYH